MLPLLVGAAVIAGAGIGWMGLKANARIAAWGEKMNELDDIFRMEAEGEVEPGQAVVRSRPADEGRPKTSFVGRHLPTGPAASR